MEDCWELSEGRSPESLLILGSNREKTGILELNKYDDIIFPLKLKLYNQYY